MICDSKLFALQVDECDEFRHSCMEEVFGSKYSIGTLWNMEYLDLDIVTGNLLRKDLSLRRAINTKYPGTLEDLMSDLKDYFIKIFGVCKDKPLQKKRIEEAMDIIKSTVASEESTEAPGISVLWIPTFEFSLEDGERLHLTDRMFYKGCKVEQVVDQGRRVGVVMDSCSKLWLEIVGRDLCLADLDDKLIERRMFVPQHGSTVMLGEWLGMVNEVEVTTKLKFSDGSIFQDKTSSYKTWAKGMVITKLYPNSAFKTKRG